MMHHVAAGPGNLKMQDDFCPFIAGGMEAYLDSGFQQSHGSVCSTKRLHLRGDKKGDHADSVQNHGHFEIQTVAIIRL